MRADEYGADGHIYDCPFVLVASRGPTGPLGFAHPLSLHLKQCKTDSVEVSGKSVGW